MTTAFKFRWFMVLGSGVVPGGSMGFPPHGRRFYSLQARPVNQKLFSDPNFLFDVEFDSPADVRKIHFFCPEEGRTKVSDDAVNELNLGDAAFGKRAEVPAYYRMIVHKLFLR